MDNKDLIEKFIEGSLSEKESSALFEELNHNSELTDELQKSLYMDELLDQSFNEEKSEDVFISELTEKLKEENRHIKQRTGKFNRLNTNKIRRVPPKKRNKPSSLILIFSAVAACFAVGLTILILSKSSTDSPRAPGQQISSNLYIQDIKGSVSVNRDGKMVELSDGDFIIKGDLLVTDSASKGSLYFISEKTKIIINPDSEFHIESDISRSEQNKVFNVRKGRVYFDVAHQKDGYNFKIKSGKADSRIIGTRLEVKNLSDSTTVKVFEGLVRVKSKLSGDIVDVPGNHYVNIMDFNFPDICSINGNTPRILGFTLIDATPDKIVEGYEILKDGIILDKTEIPQFISIRINASNNLNVDGVRNTLKDSEGNEITFMKGAKYERILPYTLTGDSVPGDYNNWEPKPGEYTLESTVYNSKKVKTDSKTLTFIIR